VNHRVRAILITPDGALLTIRRLHPGVPPYWVLPGGGVDPGEGHEEALTRELREELAATADVSSLVYVADLGGQVHHFYLARLRSRSPDPADRTGPEFTDPGRGEYHAEQVPLTEQALTAINLLPREFAEFLITQVCAGADLSRCPTSEPFPAIASGHRCRD
jgi:8-oxo-dGTP pyrophosphatase MutT (NUDIX family)